MLRFFPISRLPFVSRSRFNQLEAQNRELRSALKGANEEIQKARRLVMDLQAGTPTVLRAFGLTKYN